MAGFQEVLARSLRAGIIEAMIVILGSLSFLVLLAGLIIYFYCAGGFTKATVLPVARTMIFAGLLAFLMASGGQLQSCSGGAGGGAAAGHK